MYLHTNFCVRNFRIYGFIVEIIFSGRFMKNLSNGILVRFEYY